MLQVAGHLFIIPTYHNKQGQLWLDHSASKKGEKKKKTEGKKTKTSGGKGGANKGGTEWAGDIEGTED